MYYRYIYRYISICHRTKAALWCTPRNAKLQILLLAAVDVIYSVPRFFEYYMAIPDLAERIDLCDGELLSLPESKTLRLCKSITFYECKAI